MTDPTANDWVGSGHHAPDARPLPDPGTVIGHHDEPDWPLAPPPLMTSATLPEPPAPAPLPPPTTPAPPASAPTPTPPERDRAGRVLLLVGVLLALAGGVWALFLRSPEDSSTSASSTPAATRAVAASAPAPTRSSPRPATRATSPLPRRPAGDVPEAFLGTWTGQIVQQGSRYSPYTVRVQVSQGRLDSTIATATYPTLGCQVTWRLLTVTARVIVVQETVDSGPCIDVPITLTAGADGRIRYVFQDGIGTGVLRRA